MRAPRPPLETPPPMSMAARLRTGLVVAAVLWSAGAAAKSLITFLHTPPASATVGQALVVSGNVFGAAEMDHANLVFRSGSGPWKKLELVREGADTYRATIPA